MRRKKNERNVERSTKTKNKTPIPQLMSPKSTFATHLRHASFHYEGLQSKYDAFPLRTEKVPSLIASSFLGREQTRYISLLTTGEPGR